MIEVILTLVVGPEVGEGEDGGQHHAGHQAQSQQAAEGGGGLLSIVVVTTFVGVNELFSPH